MVMNNIIWLSARYGEYKILVLTQNINTISAGEYTSTNKGWSRIRFADRMELEVRESQAEIYALITGQPVSVPT